MKRFRAEPDCRGTCQGWARTAVRGVILAWMLGAWQLGPVVAQSSAAAAPAAAAPATKQGFALRRASAPPIAPVHRVALTVEQGVPLRVILTQKLRFRQNEPIKAKLVDPVYAFDREVAPPGAEVLGRISKLESVPRKERLAAILGGDFTPFKNPHIEFDTLVLKDGRRIPLKTTVTPGSGTAVRFDANGNRNKGRIASAKAAARQQIDARKRAVIDEIKAPGKLQRLEDAALTRLLYHPQYLRQGTRFNAELQAPLQFGTATLPPAELGEIGSQPAADSVVHARLTSALDSRTVQKGTPAEAVLSQPLFSLDHHLVFPEGSRLHGTVVQARAARHWRRNGQLRFSFQGIEPPPSASGLNTRIEQRVEGRLESVEVNRKQNVKMDEEGGTQAASSRKRFLIPAVTMVLASTGMDSERVRVHGVPTGARQANNGGRALAGGVGLGLLGGALAQTSRPLATALGWWGIARSVYVNLVARGQDVSFPVDTPVEIRFGPRGGTPK
ncbi:MAG TPA: hypothetical protein VEU62_18005 [Bryobacterales bacterium]|nr:hypothetical protein [Bryobacterales bacterium]